MQTWQWIAGGIGGTLAAAVLFKRFAPYSARISELSEKDKQKMRGVSWIDVCPVPLDDLVKLRVRYRTYTGLSSMGTLIVAPSAADDLMHIFKEIYELGFPIKEIAPIRKYEGHDPTSMAANNTSSFRCSQLEHDAAERRGSWSEHAKGEAVDINPLVNPFVTRSGKVDPPEGEQYIDRSVAVKGMVTPEVVAIFEKYGWHWGGNWSSSKDYQHFSMGGK